MSDVVFVYRAPITVLDTAIRFPPTVEAPSSSDLVLQTDNSSFILLVDNATRLQEGH